MTANGVPSFFGNHENSLDIDTSRSDTVKVQNAIKLFTLKW